MASAIGTRPGVELVPWPRDQWLRERLASAGVPRLLVVDEDAAPPARLLANEDWIRAPFSEADLEARITRVAASVASLNDEEVWLGEDRMLHRGPYSVALSEAEAALAGELIRSLGCVVSRATLVEAIWGDAASSRDHALNPLASRLRRRAAELGLVVRAERGEGLALLAGV